MAEGTGKSIGDTTDRLVLTEEAVRSQLALILDAPEFQGKTNLSNFLRFVVEETLAGRAHEIKGFTIATQVLGRKQNFDSLKDPTVRILAGKLRMAIDHYYLVPGKADSVIIEIPKGTYVPTFRCRNIEQDSSSPPRKYTIGSVAAQPTIAVMPLVNLTGDPQHEHFADGLTEELTAEVARYKDLRVISCQSSMRFKGVKISAKEIGIELGVRFLLEGSVRKEKSVVKVTVRLIDSATQIQIWGEQYRRDYRVEKMIVLQEEIATRVVARIGGMYGVIPQQLTREIRGKPPEVLESYEAVLLYHRYSLVLTRETFLRAVEAAEVSRTTDPSSGLTWSILANLYADDNTIWHTGLNISMEEALAYARKGVRIEPQGQHPRTVLAYMHMLLGERDAFFREAVAAVELNPNSPTHLGILGWGMALYGEWEQGWNLMRKGMGLAPHYPGWFHLAPFLHYYQQGRYESAYEHAKQLNMPHLFWDPLLRATALERMGKRDAARSAVADLLRLKPCFSASARHLLAFFVKNDDLIDNILDGLVRAGLMT